MEQMILLKMWWLSSRSKKLILAGEASLQPQGDTGIPAKSYFEVLSIKMYFC